MQYSANPWPRIMLVMTLSIIMTVSLIHKTCAQLHKWNKNNALQCSIFSGYILTCSYLSSDYFNWTHLPLNFIIEISIINIITLQMFRSKILFLMPYLLSDRYTEWLTYKKKEKKKGWKIVFCIFILILNLALMKNIPLNDQQPHLNTHHNSIMPVKKNFNPELNINHRNMILIWLLHTDVFLFSWTKQWEKSS